MLLIPADKAPSLQGLHNNPLDTLPLELQLQIISQLPYPDALALKHTNTHFYSIVPTTIKLKVAWLVSRHERGLPGPSGKCIMRTDAAFCLGAGGEVKDIMRRRRRHRDCTPGLRGCEVVIGEECGGPQITAKERVKDYWAGLTGKLTFWAILALVLSICMNILLISTRAERSVHGSITAAGADFWNGGTRDWRV